MAFLTVGDAPKVKQRLYILDITLPSGMQVTKIGKASGESSKIRMMQICESIFDKFRCTPSIKIVRDREVPADKVFEYETRLHQYFINYKYISKEKWSGNTEAFTIPTADAKQAYEAVLDGQVPDCPYVLPTTTIEDTLPF